jgi:hypothetical protein
VRLRAVWRDDALPQPIGDSARRGASALDVDLCVEPEQYTATFVVSAPRVGPACEAALVLIDQVIETTGLPLWQAVSFHLDEVAPPEGGQGWTNAGDTDHATIDLEDVSV